MFFEMARGLLTTLRSILEKPVTIQYPEVKRPVRTRFKGRHTLKRYENGLEKCIGCSLCSAACPADAIFVESAENTDEERYSPGERYARVYEINMLRCIFCGYCEDACPTEAIVLGDNYELSFTRFTPRRCCSNRCAEMVSLRRRKQSRGCSLALYPR